jgi:uncharacterized lipoprotein NlpE involved in copper resistance
MENQPQEFSVTSEHPENAVLLNGMAASWLMTQFYVYVSETPNSFAGRWVQTGAKLKVTEHWEAIDFQCTNLFRPTILVSSVYIL